MLCTLELIRLLELLLDSHVVNLTFKSLININTLKLVAQSTDWVFGLLIAKCKSAGGIPYDVFTKLYDSMVWRVIAYGAAVWGDKAYSCINAVQNRAMGFFLGVGKYTSNAAVSGDMGCHSLVQDNGTLYYCSGIDLLQ